METSQLMDGNTASIAMTSWQEDDGTASVSMASLHADSNSATDADVSGDHGPSQTPSEHLNEDTVSDVNDGAEDSVATEMDAKGDTANATADTSMHNDDSDDNQLDDDVAKYGYEDHTSISDAGSLSQFETTRIMTAVSKLGSTMALRSPAADAVNYRIDTQSFTFTPPEPPGPSHFSRSMSPSQILRKHNRNQHNQHHQQQQQQQHHRWSQFHPSRLRTKSTSAIDEQNSTINGKWIPLQKIAKKYQSLRRRGAAVQTHILRSAFDASFSCNDSDDDEEDDYSIYASNSTLASRDGVEDVAIMPRKRIRHSDIHRHDDDVTEMTHVSNDDADLRSHHSGGNNNSNSGRISVASLPACMHRSSLRSPRSMSLAIHANDYMNNSSSSSIDSDNDRPSYRMAGTRPMLTTNTIHPARSIHHMMKDMELDKPQTHYPSIPTMQQAAAIVAATDDDDVQAYDRWSASPQLKTQPDTAAPSHSNPANVSLDELS